MRQSLSIALAYPGASFLGVDLDTAAIAEGQRFNESLRLENIRLCASGNLRETVVGQTFDFIIAHGLFSWVDDAVREEILALVAETLEPDGVAYLSYNCYPGWLAASAIRDLFSLKTAPLRGVDRVRALRKQLADFKDALPPDAPMMATLKHSENMEDGHLAVEFFSGNCDPFYLSEFAGTLAAYGLEYLADAWPEKQFLEKLSNESRAYVAEYSDNPILQLQMADFLTNQQFRSSLIRKNSAPACRPLAEIALAPLDLHYSIAVTIKGIEQAEDQLTLNFADGNSVTVGSRFMDFFGTLEREWSASAATLASQLDLDGKKDFAGLLRKLMSHGLLFPHLNPLQTAPLDQERPALSPMNRALAHHYSIVASEDLQMGKIDFAEASTRMDGKRSLSAIASLSGSSIENLRAMVRQLAQSKVPQWTRD